MVTSTMRISRATVILIAHAMTVMIPVRKIVQRVTMIARA